MMLRNYLVLVLVAASAAWAQSNTAQQTFTVPAGVDASHITPRVPELVTRMRSNPAPKPAVEERKAGAAGVEIGERVPLKKPHSGGKRDPFVSPVVSRVGGAAPACTATGKRCLVIDQMVLRGIVTTVNGMIAVVASSANKAYFLREKDPVFNGYVVKITADSVVFKENTVDAIGRMGSREVVKKVSTPPPVAS